ncbi:MAG: RsiG family protein [Mycobacteriales bacterium]
MAAIVPSVSRQRAAPEPDARYAHLDMSGLRRYRRVLSAEEGRVSYWRRIIQARLDIVRASAAGQVPDITSLPGVFASGGTVSTRRALLDVLGSDDLPPLPDLAALWSRTPDPDNQEENQSLIHDLASAERQLSAYRGALHRRLSAATGELIARYHADPSLCLSVLPTKAPAQRRSAI